ncbi:MAG: alpha/beta hydrolase [Cyclobacteriaceae bacterium]|nr:alpha/beta hydrolase [Cyclobacteriaceae bacterium]
MIKNLAIFILSLIAAACSPRQDSDQETINKDDAFRASIKTGAFVKLSTGYTYYEFANPAADTLLVMVHGFSVPSYIWDSTFNAAVKRGYATLRYDTYGRGYSDNPDVVYDVALFSQQLSELLDSLHINRPANLMGLSDGGRTITAFAFQYPQRVRYLIYVDAAGFENLPPKDSTASLMVTEEEIHAFKQSERYQTMASGQLGDFLDSTRFRGWDKKYQEVMKYKGFVRALISTNKHRSNLENEHRRIAASGIPVIAFWGEHDKVVKLEDIRANLVDRLPDAELFVIPKAGHLPHMEQAAMFNSILFDQVICCER